MLKRLFLCLMLCSTVCFALPGCGGGVEDSVSTDEVEGDGELSPDELAGEEEAENEGED